MNQRYTEDDQGTQAEDERQAQEDEREYYEHSREIALQSAYSACRELLGYSEPMNPLLSLRVEQLALAIQGCPICRALLGLKHEKPCVTLRGQTVLPVDLDSKLRQNAVKVDESAF